MGMIQFCEVGCGDCTVIEGSAGTFLIDCHEIDQYANLLPSSKKLRGVFITHQHRDHFSGLEYLKNKGYSIDFLIYSPYKRRTSDNSVELDEWNDFKNLRDHFLNNGAEERTPYRPDNIADDFWAPGDLTFKILAPFEDLATSPTRELHDACLVVCLEVGGHTRFLVTGDASDSSLNKLAANTTNYCDHVLRASHHGSLNGADLDFVKGANAECTMVSTESGVFSNVPHPTAMKRYRDHTKQQVFRTDQDGSRLWRF